jgi:hypothetical protein
MCEELGGNYGQYTNSHVATVDATLSCDRHFANLKPACGPSILLA